MSTVRVYVNALPKDLSPQRAAELLTDYRRRFEHPGADDPPRWYCEALIAALEAVVAESAVAA